MVGLIQERTGGEVQTQGTGLDQIHLVVTEIITRKGSVAKNQQKVEIMVMIRPVTAEIETEIGTGLVIVIVMNAMDRIDTEIVMMMITIKNITETGIIKGHVTETETMIRLEIATEDMTGIMTGTTATRKEQDTAEIGVGREGIQKIITVMKLYTLSLSFMHDISNSDIINTMIYTATTKQNRKDTIEQESCVHFAF